MTQGVDVGGAADELELHGAPHAAIIASLRSAASMLVSVSVSASTSSSNNAAGRHAFVALGIDPLDHERWLQKRLTDLICGPTLTDMKIDLEKLSLRELDALLSAAEQRKKLLSRRRPPAVVRRELAAFAASHGYTIEELIGIAPVPSTAKEPSKRRKRSKVAAKYRDPDNKRNTWSGRGRMPRWLVDRTKRGQAVADFLIPGLGRPTAKKSSSIGRKSVFKPS